MTIENRIRKLAAQKVQVTITNKRRSKGGFQIIGPAGMALPVRTRAEALTSLLTVLRITSVQEWKIVPKKKGEA